MPSETKLPRPAYSEHLGDLTSGLISDERVLAVSVFAAQIINGVPHRYSSHMPAISAGHHVESNMDQEQPAKSSVEENVEEDPVLWGARVLESGKVTPEECVNLLDLAAIAVQLTAKAAGYWSWLAKRGEVKLEDVLAACSCMAFTEGLPTPQHYEAGITFLAENGLVLGGVELIQTKGQPPVWNPSSRRTMLRLFRSAVHSPGEPSPAP